MRGGAQVYDRGGPKSQIQECARVGARESRARAALRPAAGDFVLLADTSLICEPDFYRVDADRLLTRDCVQARGEAERAQLPRLTVHWLSVTRDN